MVEDHMTKNEVGVKDEIANGTNYSGKERTAPLLWFYSSSAEANRRSASTDGTKE
jgi:hypothetical protein